MKRRALFLDRDGIINEDVGYIGTIERFTFKSGIFAFLRQVQDRGYRLVIVTNQSGVARGYYTAQDHQKVMDWMLAEMRREGIVIDLALTCFEHKDGLEGPQRRVSFWRKPNAGMIWDAALRLNLDLPRSVMLGDSPSDMKAALAAGVGTCLFFSEKLCDLVGVKKVASFDECFNMMG